MKLRYYLFVAALMVMIPTVASAGCLGCVFGPKDCPDASAGEACGEIVPEKNLAPSLAAVAKPSPLAVKDQVINTAYRDTFGILREQNSCSQFFGGSHKSLTVLNGLVSRLTKESLSHKVGIQMSGQSEYVDDLATGASYRLFKRTAVNRNGPFYRNKTFSSQATVPGVGSFEPNSREVRVLMLLHEMAHLVKGTGGGWLIPDDGGDEQQSEKNTRTIEKTCGAQLKGLKNSENTQQLAQEVKQ